MKEDNHFFNLPFFLKKLLKELWEAYLQAAHSVAKNKIRSWSTRAAAISDKK